MRKRLWVKRMHNLFTSLVLTNQLKMNANSFQEIYILYYFIIDKASRWKTVLKNIVYLNIFKTVPALFWKY